MPLHERLQAEGSIGEAARALPNRTIDPLTRPEAARARTVLVLHRGGGQIRGSEEVLLAFLAGLRRDRFRPVVLHSDPVLREPLAALGVEGAVHDFPEILLSRGEPKLPLLRWFGALRRMTAVARAERAELVLASGGGPCQLGVPVARRLGVPLVCLLHHPAPAYLHRAWLTRRADRHVFISRFTADHTRERIGRGGVVVAPGIDVHGRFTPPARRDPAVRLKMGIATDEVVFAQVGALVPHKEHALLLDAFARVRRIRPNVRLLVIGAGPEEARLRERALGLGLESAVTFTGRVDDVVPFLRHVVDVNVLASREEGLGLVNVEAAACRIPTVAADATGVRESVVHGHTGLLFPPGEVGALASFMLRLARDAALRAAMGAEGRAFAVERFSLERFNARMEAVLEDALVPRAASEASAPAAAMEAAHA
ncbi:glycosyltransferase family 4 protein [Longimicrobium sp.]|uniref:glycosyltransferase family 4 protein n=1 Tax=Longimicrobium sp. TaxID=2029185 RepID=UPI002CE87C50|nr:glycosyltransferase family 4 protein [Longimicrobium sp.]HSU13283.1 glycosyltransferase family 4 protein [Longimicrobium sp.]